MTDSTRALKERLHTLRQTARFLRETAAAAGGEVRLDLIDRHSLLQTRAGIAQCKADLRAQGVIVDDMPEDTATVALTAGTEPGAGGVNVVAQTIGTIVGGDNMQGDKVLGDKHEHHHHYPASQLAPPMPLDQALALLASLPAGPDDPIPPPTTFQTSDVPCLMPLTPNDLFVGRDAALRDMAGRLKAGEGVVITTGMGGVGKTQLAVELAHRYGRFFGGGVFWLDASSSERLEDSIAACGLVLIRDSAFVKQSRAEQVRQVEALWADALPRLLIFDNGDDPALVGRHRPPAGGCRVLVTSRTRRWPAGERLVEQALDVLERAQSVALLRALASRLSEREADGIAEELGDLPLALHLAGSFLARSPSVDPTEFRERVRARTVGHPALQGHGDATAPTYRQQQRESSLEAVFQISLEQLDPHDPIDALARTLLAQAAGLREPDWPFPRRFLVETAPEQEAADPDAPPPGEEAVERLLQLGLLEAEGAGRLRLHRLLAGFAWTTLDGLQKLTLLRVQYAEQRATLRAVQASIQTVGSDTLVSPELAARVVELTAAVEQTKAELRAAGVELPGDETGEHGLGSVVDQRRGNFISGGTFHGQVVDVQAVLVSNRSQRDRDNRLRMLRQIQRFWIAGVLDQSLYQEVMLALALRTDPQAVGFSGPQLAVRLDQTPRLLPPGTPIAQVYRQADQRLLILGAPGAGKTTLLLELTRSLLAEAEHDETRPLPVIFNLSSWAQQRLPLEQWMLLELREQYGVGRRIARQWLAENRILPLLDGLDEVAIEQRAACIGAVNRFLAEHGSEGIVICSRSADYAAAGSRLLLNQAVQILPLDDAQIEGYLTRVGRPLVGVRAALVQDAELRELVRTPLLLNILALTYQGHHLDEPIGLRTATLRHRLIDSYVQRVLDRSARNNPKRYTRAQTLHWLRWLTRRLVEENQTIFQVEAIQPWWLRGRWQRTLYVLFSTAGIVTGGTLIGTLAGLLFGLISGLCIDALNWGFPEAIDLIIQLSGQSRNGLGLSGALDAGLGSGWLFGLAVSLGGGVGVSLHQHPPGQRRGWHVVAGVMLALLPGSLVSLLVLDGWISFVICMGLSGILLGIATGVLIRRGAIQPTEALHWNRHNMHRRWHHRARFGLLIGFVFALLVWLSIGTTFGLDFGLGAMLTVGLFFGLIGYLLGGIDQVEVQTKTQPNQGIWRSLGYAVVTWLVVGGAVATVASLGIAIVFGLSTAASGGPESRVVSGLIVALQFGLIIALASGPPAGLYFGGIAVAQHFAVRLIGALCGDMPWNYPRFLNYAEDLMLLRRVGGSYIFVHHLVLEHFAKDEPGTETNLLENINSFPLFYRSHLFTRFEGLDPRQPLTVGNWTPLIIWVGPFDDPRGGENRKPFQFVFPTDVDYAEFIVAVKVDNPGWDVRAAEPILIVEKPGRTSQEAVFTIIARHASTATLYITITQRGTGVVVQHLWLEVSAALMTDLSKKLVGTTPSPETFDQHDTEGTSDLPPFSAGPQQSSFTGSISPKQTHHKEASEPQSTRIHKLAAYIKRRICHTSKQSYFAEKQAEENSPGSIYTNVPDQHHSPQTVLFPLDSSGSTRRDITITLQPSGYDSSSYTAYVQATFPDRSLVRDYQLALRIEELQRLTARLRSAMNQVAVFDEPNNPSPFRNITITDDVARRSVVPLADAGQLVWRQLFDRADNPELQALGQRLRSLPDGTSVQFVLKSSEFVLPWAVLYDGPGPVTPENLNWRAFWGYRYQIDTLLQGSYPSPTIERTAPELYALLNNGDLLSHSETQASHITQNLPQIRAQVLWGDDACAFLSRGPVSGDMVYCFCHGDDKSIRPQSDQLPSEAVLRFGARAKIRLADINVESCSQPLVFLNACETAALQPFHRDGFAPFFLQRWGARGFVGNEIKVPQTLGHDFALHFWELFVSGVPVGKILWQLRRYYVETHCNALAFTYSLYGHGDTCLRTGSVDNKHG